MRRMITELPARVINRWQVQGGDVAILPVGSAEALGPHLPLGARAFVAEAFARVLAEAGDGLCLPAVPLTPLFGTQRAPGGIDVDEPPVNRLIRSVLDDLVETGFRRIVLVTFLEYAAYYLPQEVWEDTKALVVGADLNERLQGPMKAHGVAFDSVVVGALRILGRERLVEKCLAARGALLAEGFANAPPGQSYAKIRKIGVASARFPAGHFPEPPGEQIDAEAGADVIREAALEGVPALDAMRRYNEFTVRRSARGFLKGAWFKRPLDADGEGRGDE